MDEHRFKDNSHTNFGTITPLQVIVGSLLFALGWHLRGSGTSDPTIPMAWFLFFIILIYGEDKFARPLTYPILGITIFLFRISRRGWGTFVSQTGFPGIYTGLYYASSGEYLPVPWWQGYFWLFIVGIAWAGPASFYLGGMYFSGAKFDKKDYILLAILYIGGFFAFQPLSKALIPYISPDAYRFYVEGDSPRNYKSMIDNLSYTLAMVPILLYIALYKKQKRFAARMCAIMAILGVALSIAGFWQMLGFHNPDWGIPFWSLWEYTSGLFMGLMLLPLFNRYLRNYHKESALEAANLDEKSVLASKFHEKKWVKLYVEDYFLGHFMVFLFGIQETVAGMLTSIFSVLDIGIRVHTWQTTIIMLIIDVPLYYLHNKGKIFSDWTHKPMREKSLLFLLIWVPFSYFAWMIQFFIMGNPFVFDNSHIMQVLNGFSFLIIESYLFLQYKLMKQGEKKGERED